MMNCQQYYDDVSARRIVGPGRDSFRTLVPIPAERRNLVYVVPFGMWTSANDNVQDAGMTTPLPVGTHREWDVKVGFYAVAFLDLLGQKDAMKQISVAFEEAFRQNPGAIDMNDGGVWTATSLKLREAVSRSAIAIESFFGLYDHLRACSENQRKDLLGTIRPDKKAEADSATRMTIHQSRLSDGLVLFMRIRPDPEYPSASDHLPFRQRLSDSGVGGTRCEQRRQKTMRPA